MFEDVLKPALYPQAQDLIDEARRAGCRIVLVTGALDFTMRPLARYLGADDLIANKMQFVGGNATGKVIPPIIEGANKANAIRDYCVQARGWRWPSATPTPTAPPTTPCSPSSAGPPRSTRTCACARWRAPTTGPSSTCK